MKKLRITIEGKAYEVLVEILDQAASPVATAVPTTAAVAVAGAPAGVPAATAVASPPQTSAAPGSGDVVSPLAGKIVSIDVTVGQSVDEGAQVATIEAMKMNTYIYAPKAGRVAAVLARPGDAVEEGVALLRLG
jgi:biotin carboxyl carrier protein